MQKFINVLIISILFFLNSNSFAETPPDHRQCIQSNWKGLSLKLADNTVSPSWRDECGDSMATLHMYYGSSETALNYIQREIELKTPIKKLESAFYTAIRSNFQQITRILLDYGVPANATEKSQYSPLMIAAADGNLEILRMLIKAGADVNYESSKQDALVIAIEHGHIYATNLLLEHAANIDQYKSHDFEGYLLKLAIKNGNYDLVELLINRGFKLNVQDENGNSLLHYSIENGIKYNMIEFLIQQGADPCFKNTKNENAKMLFDRLKKQPNFNPYSESNYGNLFVGLCKKNGSSNFPSSP